MRSLVRQSRVFLVFELDRRRKLVWCEVLGHLGGSASADGLLILSRDDSEKVRWAAVRCMAAFDPGLTLARLDEMARSDASSRLRDLASSSLDSAALCSAETLRRSLCVPEEGRSTASRSGCTLGDLIRGARAMVPLDSDESLLELTELFYSFARSPDALGTAILTELREKRLHGFGRSDQYSPDVILIHYEDAFQIRACIWMTSPTLVEAGDEVHGIPYGVLHDHDYSFLTTVVHGPGYVTDLWRYSARAVQAAVSGRYSAVAARRIGQIAVVPENVYLYQACTDVHSQMPVDDLTITMNLLGPTPAERTWPQLRFDSESGECLGPISHTSTKRVRQAQPSTSPS